MAETLQTLYQRRHALLRQVDQAGPLLTHLDAAQAPYAQAFVEAHDALLADCKADPMPHTAAIKAYLRAGYDRRMRAGHAWHPHREKFKDVKRWHDALIRELTLLNKEIKTLEAHPAKHRGMRRHAA